MVTIPEDELQAIGVIGRGWKVVELGNKKNATGCYREWYVAQGCDYECIDWNAEDGAIFADLGAAFPGHLIERVGGADLVTNFGCMEHVLTDQVQGWLNVAMLSAKVGCRLAMVMPAPGHWEHHGVYQPSLKWYERWANMNGYGGRIWYNEKRTRHTIVCSLERHEPFEIETYYQPPSDWVHITPKAKRVNPLEKKHG